VVLDNDSHRELADFAPEGWRVYAHHMTVVPPTQQGSGPRWEYSGYRMGDEIGLRAVAIARNDRVIAVAVETDIPTKASIPHVTIATNPETGGKPKDSNDFNENDFEPLDEPIELFGTLEEVQRGSQLSEAVRDTHGYSIRSVEDVKWSRSKASTPVSSNPFVGGSSAFNSWYNDGQMKKGFMQTIARDTPDERRRWMNMDVLFNEGDHVIIPALDRIDGDFTLPGVIMRIHHLSAADEGVRGAGEYDSIPLVNIRWQLSGGGGMQTRWLMGVGLAFLHRVAGPKGYNAHENASDAMKRHRSGAPSESPRRERERQRDERPASPPPAAEPPPSRTIRRVGGVPSASERPPSKPVSMSSDDVRQMLGLKRR
jgi:hypothetical protein